MHKPENIKAIIFDLDGVLIDSESIHQKRNEKMFRDNGWDVDPKVLELMIGASPSMDPWKMIYDRSHLNVDYVTYRKKIDEYKTNHFSYDQNQYIDAIYPDTYSTVSTLYDHGYKLAVASSSALDYIRMNLRLCHLEDMISVVKTGRDLVKSKPDPLIYTLTLKELMVEPSEAVIVEDSPYGIEAGKKAGCFTIGVHGYQFNLDQTMADVRVRELSEVLSYLID